MNAPTLPAGCNSWILVDRLANKAHSEYFSRKNADKLARLIATEPDAARRYELLPAVDWLVRFNNNVRV